MRNLLRKIIGILPTNLSYPIIRSMVQINSTMDSDLRFKIAETQDDLKQAFKILHDSYVEVGFMKPAASGLRVTKYHALPQTTLLIAKKADQVIATMSIIKDNPLGLPLDADFDTSIVRKKSKKVVEISALSIAKGYRGQQGMVLFGMFKFAYTLCKNYLKVDGIQLATSPKRQALYEAVLVLRK